MSALFKETFMERNKEGKPSGFLRPYQELGGRVNDEGCVTSALRNLLFEVLRVPWSYEPILVLAILRQAHHEVAKKQYTYLSHAVMAVVSLYRFYDRGVPLRGFHLLWIIECGGWQMHQVNHTLSMLRDLYGWVDGLLDSTDGHAVSVNPHHVLSTQNANDLIARGVLSSTTMYLPVHLSRESWIHQMIAWMFGEYAQDFRVYVDQRALPIAISSLVVSYTSELFGLVLVTRSCEEKKGRVTPDFFMTVFTEQGLICWRICLLCHASRGQINHRLIMYLLHMFDIWWLHGILETLEQKQFDPSLADVMVAHPELFFGKRWEEVWPILLAWREGKKDIGDLPKMFHEDG